ncbi:hypothetical protein [Microbulbifer discodermiae]|uniref:hypothetical protein n=1 Tax=Microbulbifer sp. 2201CG32-9 TaxID=3232309 RepID=UPI00345C259B
MAGYAGPGFPVVTAGCGPGILQESTIPVKFIEKSITYANFRYLYGEFYRRLGSGLFFQPETK